MDSIDLAQNPKTIAAKTIIIKDIELGTRTLHDLPYARKLYVQFSVDNAVRSTDVVKEEENWTCWDEKLFLDTDDASVFIVKVYKVDHLNQGSLVAGLADTVCGIFGKLRGNVFEGNLEINTAGSYDDWDITIKFALVAELREGINAEELRSAYAVTKATKAQAFQTTWSALLQRMELVDKLVVDITELHLYMSLTRSVLSAANRVFAGRKNHDDLTIRLANTMSNVMTFVHSVEPLKIIKAHIRIVALLIAQVTECGYFIIGYIKRKNFLIRTARYSISDIDAIVTGYENKLRELRSAFWDGCRFQGGITVVRMMNVVEHTVEHIDLSSIPHVHGAGYRREEGCFPGTRKSVIREIYSILNNPADDAPPVCLLTGIAGSGKSAVAHTIARMYDEQERLGSSYFFSRSDVARRNPGNLFGTIARNLSSRDLQYKSALWRIVKSNRVLCASASPLDQIEQLIIRPSTNLHSTGPIVVVVDALDESGSANDRYQLLGTLSRHITEWKLPTNLRFLITTRPESDILDTLSNRPHVIRIDLADVPDAVVDRDIGRFVCHSLCRYTELDSSWPSRDWCRLLVQHSRHIFQWASIACKFIMGCGTAGLDMCERLWILLKGYSSEGFHPLDGLYWTILEQQIGLRDVQRQFRDVMALILALKEPLSLASLSALCGNDLNVRDIVELLGSLLDGSHDENKPICLLASFCDFLLDEARSSVFHICILPHHSLYLGQASLARMRDMLRFDIYETKNSQHCNITIPDLSLVVTRVVPPHLSYSCQYWMDHLQHVDCDPKLLTEVTLFFKNSFPYWLEVLSFLSLSSPLFIQSAKNTCAILMVWAKGQEIANLVSNALQFIQVFVPVLRESASKLFISDMPQTSYNSLCPLWADHLQKQLSVSTQHTASWPTQQLIEVYAIEEHTDFVRSVDYSPNGRHIVSASWDKTIRIWDASTGQCMGDPFWNHTFFIDSVAYSPDGRYIAIGCADKTVRVLNAITGQPIADPFHEHTQPVKSIAYSPDGKHIISGSMDTTIRAWDSTTGHCMAGPFQGHTDVVNSVAYSPDGSHIVSGSHDYTIRVWDATSAQCVVCPFQGHTYPVTSVSYSPDGKHIVSGSQDTTIRIWDASTGQCVTGPFWGHTMTVCSAVYSPNGMFIISGSQDFTIRVWDASTGQCTAGSFQGHTHHITSVACSPDGRNIVSSSWDKTIRVWNMKPTQNPFQGHISSVRSVCYSPNNRYIASGSWDKTIRVWDANTGQCTIAPFEGHIDSVQSIAYSPNGMHIVSGSADETIRIWDAITGQCVAGPFWGHTNNVRSVVYSPNGMYVASGSEDKTIRVWNVNTGQCVAGPFLGHTDGIQSVAYSPDGIFLASGSMDKTIRVWDVITGQCVANPLGDHAGWIWSVAYSPNGMYIASGSSDKTIKIWNATTGQCIACSTSFQGHTETVFSVTYSPDGRHIVSGSDDNSIRIWDATTGQHVTSPLQGHIETVYSVAFSPDCMHIVSGSSDNIIRVWDTTSGQCVAGSDMVNSTIP